MKKMFISFVLAIVLTFFLGIGDLCANVSVSESIVGNGLANEMGPYKYDDADYGGALSSKVYNNTHGVNLYETKYDLGVKYSANGANFCTNYEQDASIYSENICTITTDWDSKTRAGVAAIINLVGLNVGDTVSPVTKEYFFGTLAINTFLRGQGHTDVDSSNPYYNDYYKAYLDAANNARNNYPTLSISTNDLVFTKIDNKYVSDLVIVDTNVENYSVIVKIGDKTMANVVETLENGFKISIPESEIEIGKKNPIVATLSASKQVGHARNYDCGENAVGEKYQTITPANVENVNVSFSATLQGEISINTSLTIKKIDEDKKILPGVVLKVESKENNYSEIITTTDKEIVLENLQLGKYTITEVSTPDGYVKLDKPVEVTLSYEKLNEAVTLSNSLTRVEISKINSVDSKLLPGAVLQIQDKDGNVLKDANDKKYEWTSTDKVHVITGLAKGTYYLVEISAPEGYELNEKKIEFEVDGKKSVIKVEMKNNIEVKVPDTLSSRSVLLITISMFDIFLGIGIITYVKKSKIQE